ncbi:MULTISPECIES: hypothetical protein [Asticcacaulis]|uniref:hypothetical protein n=1 Tax=Asticcacaulis TaxID=76890 RepID=UPI001AE4D0E6|nr:MULTISPECIES: hypothetical protein [Asticcacaulis]MBP2159542.1 hypothetical protein [Asticcacaulis solisilvae]MDR6800631.1 hypothetical protein [Asticcacaulis sp. BE141]
MTSCNLPPQDGEGRHAGEADGSSKMSVLSTAADKAEDSKSPLPDQLLNKVSGPLARRGAVETSRDAAKVARKSHSKRCRRAYGLIKAAGDATCEEIQQTLGADGEHWLLTTVRARVCDLRRDGYVTKSGRKGIGESGVAKVTAWRVTSEAERAEILAERARKAVADVPPSVLSEACARARAVLAESDNIFDAMVKAFSAQIVAEGGANG